MTPPASRRRSLKGALFLAGVALGVGSLVIAGTSSPGTLRATKPPGTPVASPSSIDTTPPTTPAPAPPDAFQVSGATLTGASVPPGFVALSVEAQSIADGSFSAKTPGLVDLLRGLHPGFLRIGANTGDSDPLNREALASLAQLSAAVPVPIVLQLPFRRDRATPAVAEAVAAARDLGRRLVALEIGNEPDAYGLRGIRPQPWTYDAFVRQRDGYRLALAKAGLTTPLWGPDDSGSQWLGTTVAEHERPYAVITQHFYPLSRCRPPTPTIRALLSDTVLAKEQSEAALLGNASRFAKLPVVVGETNSVSCYGGLKGVSNTAASALWALDYGLVMARAGVSALAFHVPLSGCAGYSPLCLVGSGASRHWVATPEYDGLATLSSLTGDRFLSASMTSVHHHLRTHALESATGGLVLVVLDLDPAGRGTARLSWQHSAAAAAIMQTTFGSPDYASTVTSPMTTSTTAPAGSSPTQVLALSPGTASVFTAG